MAAGRWQTRFWWRWVVANGLAELLGLGTVAAVGFLVVTGLGEPRGGWQAAAFALGFVLLGAFEGFVVGFAQARVLRQELPGLRGWVQATVLGAVVAWMLGMAPSTVMSFVQGPDAGPGPQIGEPLRLLLAGLLGLVTGPVLAVFQWRRLRPHVKGAGWWLPANALAWAAGMPIVFLGAHTTAYLSDPRFAAVGVAATLALAGAVVGGIHGRVLLWLLARPA